MIKDTKQIIDNYNTLIQNGADSETLEEFLQIQWQRLPKGGRILKVYSNNLQNSEVE